MRLIDADAFLKTENERCNGEPIIGTCTGNNEYLRHRIESQPTAYDVDKVVEQLEELAKEHEYKVTGKPDTYSEYNEGWGDCADRAVDIVERGGINEQTNNQK